MQNNTEVIKSEIYPLVEKSLNGRGMYNFVKLISDFLKAREKQLYSSMPLDRIPYSAQDRDKMFDAIGISPDKIKEAIDNTYYANERDNKFVVSKDPLSVLLLNIVRYFLIKGKTKALELALVYLSFSGKIYPSIHYKFFKIPPIESVMEYAINNMANNKFDIKSQGSVFAAVKSKSLVWVNTYARDIRSFSDQDVSNVLQFLRSRINAFMRNIASIYYKAYENKDNILYSSDQEDSTANGGYHLAQADSYRAEKAIESTMSAFRLSGANYTICKLCSNATVKTDELKAIIESIINVRSNMILIHDVVSTLVYTYFIQAKDKTVVSSEFIRFSIIAKPNTKDENLIKMKKTVESWLEQGSALYRRRMNRLATKNNYVKALIMYFAYCIYQSNK